VAVGAIALFAIYLPTFFMQAALRGINAAVMGILTAALYTSIWTSAIMRPADFALGSPPSGCWCSTDLPIDR
jgi:chromate transporter